MQRASILRAAIFISVLATGGCAKTTESTTTTSSDANAVASPAASAVATTAPATTVPVATASPAAVVAPTSAVTFDDISGTAAAVSIQRLGALGVLDPGPHFSPGDPIKRRDYIRWLVKTNNALWSDQPSKQVHLAEKSEKSDFSDVASSDPDFAFIQGMSDAGISVGFPDKTFKPDASLTREQMLAIKSGLDRGGVSKS
ncbi:MAG: S-layer homology domain-containing protein, partial [Candidatus Eremiobacteraeota bacterium]|nr:S-layer homology domain-containing protein [Candidatus Eremiobacteraeota bacterium]